MKSQCDVLPRLALVSSTRLRLAICLPALIDTNLKSASSNERLQMKINRIIERKLVEAKRQLDKNETGNALILLDQILETCLREECLKLGASSEKEIDKPLSA
jgi:hypothetical protein